MLKNKYVVIIGIFIIASLITIISCGRKGTLNPNTAPYIEITEYRGVGLFADLVDSLNAGVITQAQADSIMFETIGDSINLAIYDSLFYQVIHWNAWDVDGNVVSYAYRIGTWDSLSNDWVYDRAYGVQTDPVTGWVLHLQPDSTMDIWTAPNKRYPGATVFFPSTDTTDFRKNFGKFEVKCKDNSGEVSKTAVKYFVTWSDVPETSVGTSQGVIDSCRVGTAILFNFKALKDADPYGDEPAYFKYRLVYYEKTNAADSMTVEWNEAVVLDSTIWYSTKDFPDDPSKKDNKSQVLLMKNYPEDDPHKSLKPTLKVNDLNEVTQIQAKTVDKAGIEDPNYAKMTFFVRGHFKPETCPFMSSWESWPSSYYNLIFGDSRLNITPHIYVLGEYSYLPYMSTTEEMIPSKFVTADELHYADRFYMDTNGNISAIWSDDIEINMKWHYLGEYQYVEDKKTTSFAGNTYNYDKSLSIYEKYFCDIAYMDIQLDGGTDGLPSISTHIISDSLGDWMRIPIYEDQKCKLFNIAPGQHTFRVRAVDYQGAVDTTPESLAFVLYERKGADAKSGVLLVDDTKGTNIYAVEDSVDIFYNHLLEDCPNDSIFDLQESPFTDTKILNQDIRNDKPIVVPYFAPSDIQGYKLIIWHANNPKELFPSTLGAVHLVNHYDILRFYLNSGGNLLFTGCAKVWDPDYTKTNFLQDYAGLSDSASVLNNESLYESWDAFPATDNSMFGGANGTKDFSDIDTLHLNLKIYHIALDYYFPECNTHLQPLRAMGKITVLDIVEADPIFTCIPGPLFPNPETYDGTCVGSKYTKEPGVTGKTYILGFPLYYIELDDAKAFIHKVFDEVGITYNP
ncbi:MAG: hypothetical protein J7J77_02040 [Candidatus Cloacimonetes bacterium]|nr:hypothetical protein [Candidatus Cloacimonadota bacterium]